MSRRDQMMELLVGVPARQTPLDVATTEPLTLSEGGFNTVPYSVDLETTFPKRTPETPTNAQTPASNRKTISSTGDDGSPKSFTTPSRAERQYGKTDSPFIPDIHPTPARRRRPPFSRRRRSGSSAYQKMAVAIPSIDDELLGEERYKQQMEEHTEWKLANIRNDAGDGLEDAVMEGFVTEREKRKRSEDPEEDTARNKKREKKASGKGQEDGWTEVKRKTKQKERQRRTKRRGKKAEEA